MCVSSLLITSVSKAQAASSPFSVMEDFIKYENQQEWSKIPALWDKVNEKSLKSFVSNRENKLNNIGLFNIKKAKIVRWKELNPNDARHYSFVTNQSAKYYYVAVEYQVRKEDKYHLNGINYHLAVITQDNREWKISQFSTAPVDLFIEEDLDFGTPDEKEMALILKQRFKGEFVNRSGRILEINKATPEQLLKERGQSPLSTQKIKEKLGIMDDSISIQTHDHTQPADIRVYITQSKNVSYYGCSGCVRRPGFTYYVQNVLPNEWGPSWHPNSLKTGALCAKMYGWYGFYYPLASSVGADVYDDTRSQVFLVNTSLTATNYAISNVAGIGIHRKDNKALFLTEYIAGSYATGGKSGGKVWQWGSKYFADNGQLPYQILSYYYDGSSKVGGSGKIYEFFTY